MATNTLTRASFLSRILVPVASFVLLLSLAGNAFLIVTRQTNSSPSDLSPNGKSLSSSRAALASLAFGDISRPIPVRPQLTNASGAALNPVNRYVLPPSIVPAIPAELAVYRDQGTELDTSSLSALFHSLRAPVDPLKMQLLPETETFKSADGLLKVSLSLPTRTLTITRVLQAERTTPPERADDAEVLALAKTFAATLNIDLTGYGAPQISETKATGDQPKKTFVTWPMTIGAVPVIGADGQGIAALSMQIGRVSHRAVSATMSLLSPEVLAASNYPTLSSQMLEVRFLSGGLLPFPRGQNAPSVTYSTAQIVYLLLPQDDRSPTYLVPAIRASFQSDGKSFSTLLPLLDRTHFDWQ